LGHDKTGLLQKSGPPSELLENQDNFFMRIEVQEVAQTNDLSSVNHIWRGIFLFLIFKAQTDRER
jgi:hypothetical protein